MILTAISIKLQTEDEQRFPFNSIMGLSVFHSLRLVIAFLVICGLCPTLARGDIYKYVDESGVIHLTNIPSRNGVQYTLVWRERIHIDARVDVVQYDSMISRAAQKYNIEKNLIRAVIKAESNFNPKAVSPVGARGLMQLMPATAAYLNVPDSFHPESNIEGGVKYLRYLFNLYQGDLKLALAAYNAGEGAVMRYGNRIPPFPETQTYVKRVLALYHTYNKQMDTLARANR